MIDTHEVNTQGPFLVVGKLSFTKYSIRILGEERGLHFAGLQSLVRKEDFNLQFGILGEAKGGGRLKLRH